jgi:hypothetical protein
LIFLSQKFGKGCKKLKHQCVSPEWYFVKNVNMKDVSLGKTVLGELLIFLFKNYVHVSRKLTEQQPIFPKQHGTNKSGKHTHTHTHKK